MYTYRNMDNDDYYRYHESKVQAIVNKKEKETIKVLTYNTIFRKR